MQEFLELGMFLPWSVLQDPGGTPTLLGTGMYRQTWLPALWGQLELHIQKLRITEPSTEMSWLM